MPENKAIFAVGPAGLMVLAFYLACIWTVATVLHLLLMR